MLGILVLEIHLPFVRSLKEKRKYISVLRAISKDFSAAFSELEHHEKWNISRVAYVVVGNNGSFLDSILEKIIDKIDEQFEIVEIRKSIEPIPFDVI